MVTVMKFHFGRVTSYRAHVGDRGRAIVRQFSVCFAFVNDDGWRRARDYRPVGAKPRYRRVSTRIARQNRVAPTDDAGLRFGDDSRRFEMLVGMSD